MKRIKRHKIKHEKPETSSAFSRAMEEHDLAYYIHDRVELMHQVFSVLRAKDLKAMAPECVRRLSIDDLQELCTEELLGISSKRLLAILDGAEPPSDTESSSQSSEHVEAISLDSISSDEEILSQGTKKKRKHKRRDSKSKKHKSKKQDDDEQVEPEKNKASRAGLTVLELLELQARARAIRAQLQQEHAKRSETTIQTVGVESSQQSSDSDVEVKEEPAEVVEIISSDDEKPQIQHLENATTTSANKESEKTASNKTTATVTSENDKETSKKKKKKDKSNKKEKEKKQKDTATNKNSDKTIKESTTNKETDKTKDDTEKGKDDSSVMIEIDSKSTEDNNRVTKRVNDLIITVPQHTTRKIKLNRNKMTVSIPNNAENDVTVVENTRTISSVVTRPEKSDDSKKLSSVVSRPKTIESTAKKDTLKQSQDKNTDADANISDKGKNKDKTKKKPKKKVKRQSIDEDHDEITLQLSDSEKMDLLENFDKRNYDNVSSSSSDSESSSSDNSEDSDTTQDTSKEQDETENKPKDTILDKQEDISDIDTQQDNKIVSEDNKDHNKDNSDSNPVTNAQLVSNSNKDDTDDTVTEVTANNKDKEIIVTRNDEDNSVATPTNTTNSDNTNENPSAEIINKESEHIETKNNEPPTEIIGFISPENVQHNIEITKIDDIPIREDSENEPEMISLCKQNKDNSPENSKCKESDPIINKEDKSSENNEITEEKQTEEARTKEKELSEGELTENESSEVEALELQPEVVCISDEETPKKKKKKDKKAKKEKKKKADFRESADENFYKDSKEQDVEKEDKSIQGETTSIILDADDDIYEILELSDDSSCYEVEGTVLSKEPTVEEIAALSAKIDEIEREDVVTDTEILIYEKSLEDNNKNTETSLDVVENISWKDRYLDSKKVKKVLTTSNILNALRKKNKELKKKMEESKKKEQEIEAQKAREEAEKERIIEAEKEKVLEEGSIEQYNTLEASTKYVNPVPDPVELAKKQEEELKEQQEKEAEIIKEKEKEVEEAIKARVTGEMKKDAKQLLNMYKKLLKYNDIKKQKDPNKKKNKKKKKKEKDNVNSASVASS